MARRKKDIWDIELVDPKDLPFDVRVQDAWNDGTFRDGRDERGNVNTRPSSRDVVNGKSKNDIVRGDKTDKDHASTLNGLAGDDLIIGYGGADIIDGGAGIDRVHYKTRHDNDVTFDATSSDRYENDGAGRFTIGSGTNHVWQRITTYDDDGVAVHSHFKGIESFVIKTRGGNDVITTGAGEDVIHGRAGQDTLNGGGGDDILHGGKQGDVLNGGAGDDFLRGGAGRDLMTGGAGDDIFVLAGTRRLGADIVTDWQTGSDKIQVDVTGTPPATLAALLSAAGLKIVTGQDFSHRSNKLGGITNDKNINDVAIFESYSNGKPLMILEDWSGTLDITHFDIV